jgi:glycosyltransferase involved in cell wall biosynthesis
MTLFFFSNFHIGGAQKIAINLINKLNTKDKSIKKIITINSSGPLKKIISDSIQVYDLKKSRLIDCIFEYKNFIEKNNVQKIFCVQPHLAIFCYFINLIFNKKIKIIARETNSNQASNYRIFTFKEKIFLIIKNFVYRKIHLIICPSRGLENEIIGRKIFISNFVETKILSKMKTKESNYILGVGRLVKQKRFHDLINAYNLIQKQIEENLIIIGEGPEKVKLDRLIKKLKLNKKIKILPFNNYLSFLANCKIFVQTSAWEGMPNILIEAMVLRKKIVATDCFHGPKEILFNGKYGSLCSVGNIEEISKKIIKTIKSRKPFISKKFINKFSINYALERYYKILK